jgi:hypothetical protein
MNFFFKRSTHASNKNTHTSVCVFILNFFTIVFTFFKGKYKNERLTQKNSNFAFFNHNPAS